MRLRRFHTHHYRSRPLFPLSIFILGLLTTFLAAFYIDRVADSKDKLYFDRIVTRRIEAIDKRLDTYIAMLRAGAGMFSSQQYITRNEFHSFASHLELRSRYNGIQGIGFSERFSSDKKQEFIELMEEEGYENFTIYPDDERDVYHVIKYLEPFDDRNKKAIGFDMYSERTRRDAMQKAMETGQPTISGIVTLVQEITTNKQPGFLIYMPVYFGGTTPSTITERKELLYGYVYGPFRANDFFYSIFGHDTQSDADMYIYDGTKPYRNALLFTNADVDKSPAKESVVRNFSIAGRTWTLYFAQTRYFIYSTERSLVPFLLAGGIFTSLALFGLSHWQYVARVKAEKLAEELSNSQVALQESETRLRRIVDANIIGVFFADADGVITNANKAFLEMVKLTKRDLRKREITIANITPHEYHDQYREELRELHKKGFHTPYEKEYLRKDGSRVPVLIGKTFTEGKKGQIIGLVINLTERKKLERQKDDFISIASHELKTPVTSLKAYVQVLTRRFQKQGNIETAEQLKKMDLQLTKLTNLIKDLLDVTKIESGRLSMKFEQFDINSLTKETIEEMQRTTDKHRISVEGNARRKVFGDRERIGQVLMNLLSNAIKYSPDAKKIDVSVIQTDEETKVCVRDYGVGIPKELQKHIFERFFRVSGNREDTFPGLGLGLYVSADIIKRHKGKIWVESEKDQGALFCFTIPSK